MQEERPRVPQDAEQETSGKVNKSFPKQKLKVVASLIIAAIIVITLIIIL